jgi:hypothetical protein
MESVRAWNVTYDLAAGESRIFLPIESHIAAHKSDNGQCFRYRDVITRKREKNILVLKVPYPVPIGDLAFSGSAMMLVEGSYQYAEAILDVY